MRKHIANLYLFMGLARAKGVDLHRENPVEGLGHPQFISKADAIRVFDALAAIGPEKVREGKLRKAQGVVKSIEDSIARVEKWTPDSFKGGMVGGPDGPAWATEEGVEQRKREDLAVLRKRLEVAQAAERAISGEPAPASQPTPEPSMTQASVEAYRKGKTEEQRQQREQDAEKRDREAKAVLHAKGEADFRKVQHKRLNDVEAETLQGYPFTPAERERIVELFKLEREKLARGGDSEARKERLKLVKEVRKRAEAERKAAAAPKEEPKPDAPVRDKPLRASQIVLEGEKLYRGHKGPGVGYLKRVLPDRRDGDSDTVVGERRPRKKDKHPRSPVQLAMKLNGNGNGNGMASRVARRT